MPATYLCTPATGYMSYVLLLLALCNYIVSNVFADEVEFCVRNENIGEKMREQLTVFTGSTAPYGLKCNCCIVEGVLSPD